MKKLYLLRHAHAEETAAVSMGDYERFLSPAGEKQAVAVGDFMLAEGIFPDFVLSSSSVRTLQTVRYVFGRILKEEGQRVNSQFDRALYLAPASRLLDYMCLTDDAAGSLLVAAHNPGIAELAAYLGCGAPEFPPASLAVFQADVSHWRDLGPEKVRFQKVFVP